MNDYKCPICNKIRKTQAALTACLNRHKKEDRYHKEFSDLCDAILQRNITK